MHIVGPQLVLSATDQTKHVACPHITTLDLALLRSRLDEVLEPALGGSAPTAPDDALALVFRHGDRHERTYLERLRQERQVIEIPGGGSTEAAEAGTIEAMRAGAEVIYQGVLQGPVFSGRADFLLRRDGRPSAFGNHAYDIADTKLARRLKVPALLQMASYAERLTELQGVEPEYLVVVTGDGREHEWPHLDVAAYARRVRAGMLAAVRRIEGSSGRVTDPIRVPYCAQCRWAPVCEREWSERDDLNQVFGLRPDQQAALIGAGITTMAQLADTDPAALTGVLSSSVRDRLRQQAGLQVAERESGDPTYLLLDAQPGRGLQRLPKPDSGDLYLDFEGDPWAADGRGREYLAGIYDRTEQFRCWWAHDEEQEQILVEKLIDHFTAARAAHPSMHVYHYAPYEVTALKKLTGRYGTREAELDVLLRAEVFVDLYAVVRQSIQVSKSSYSIKKMEAFYWAHTRAESTDDAVNDAMTSVVEYERWLVEPDQAILDRLADYNREDVRSTLALHDWLEQLRVEAEAASGQTLARFSSAPTEQIADPTGGETERAETQLAARLLEQGHDLLAGCVGWHRREARPRWWDFYHYGELSDEELVENSTAIGGVGAPVAVGTLARSTVWRYPMPVQDFVVEDKPYDVDLRKAVGEVVARDPDGTWVEIKRSATLAPVAGRGLQPGGPVNDQVIRDAIGRVAEQVLAGAVPLGQRLIDRQAPALPDVPGADPSEVVRSVGSRLDGAVLAVQGPPGTGKTYAAAQLIRDLLDSGQKVAVTALSHAVVLNLLAEVGRPAHHRGPVPDEPRLAAITEIAKSEQVAGLVAGPGPLLIGGTAWLWSRRDLAESVDVLVIDEAGQFSLANAVAVSQSARSLVLLGDPQQLSQPTQATHPFGSGISALDHWLDGHPTMPPGRGVFLDTTWRMHPSITRFVSTLCYEGRLRTRAGRERQTVVSPGGLTGSGLRWVPVEHEGCASASPAEARVVAELVEDLLRGAWTDHEGVVCDLTVEDILVVAPFNAQLHELRKRLPHGVRIGTVDKFQGRQAPVVIYSLTCSSAADAPRGIDFLYDVHRLNVAVSRAKALAVIVGSEALLDAPAASPDQVRAVNALCRYVEDAAATP